MRISIGSGAEISATERFLTEIRNGNAFQASFDLGASVGNAGVHQLFNPAASGVIVLVELAAISSDIAMRFHLRRHNAAFGAVFTDVNLSTWAFNAAAAEARQGSTNINQGSQIGSWDLPANTAFAWPFGGGRWVCELPQGEGVLFQTQTLNLNTRSTFRWVELPA